jgi:hypothetical protein
MTITNTHGIAQWISLLQLPTNYDGDIFLLSKGELEKTFLNTWIIRDNYFKKVEKYFTKICIITFTSHAGRPKMIKKICTNKSEIIIKFSNVSLFCLLVFMLSVFQQLKRNVIDMFESSLITRLSKFISFIAKALWESNQPIKSFQIVLYITI